MASLLCDCNFFTWKAEYSNVFLPWYSCITKSNLIHTLRRCCCVDMELQSLDMSYHCILVLCIRSHPDFCRIVPPGIILQWSLAARSQSEFSELRKQWSNDHQSYAIWYAVMIRNPRERLQPENLKLKISRLVSPLNLSDNK